MEMCLRITDSKMGIFKAARANGEEFAKSIIDEIEPGFDEDDDDTLDLEVKDIEQLSMYLKVFEVFPLELFTTAKSEKYEFCYSVCNGKAMRFSGREKVSGQMRLKRGNIIGDTQERINKAVEILQGGEWERSKERL